MWGFLSTGNERKDSRPVADKEEYDNLVEENERLKETARIMSTELHDTETKLGVTRKKAKEIEALDQKKYRLICLLGANAEIATSSDLKEAASLKTSISSRIKELENENSKQKEVYAEYKGKALSPTSHDSYNILQAKTAEIARLVITGVVPKTQSIPEEKIIFPSDEELKAAVYRVDNIAEVKKAIEKIPDPCVAYDKHRVLRLILYS